MESNLFKTFAALPDLFELIVQLIFPGVYGNEHIKQSMVLSLFSNTLYQCLNENEIINNDHLHILLLGPSCEEIMSQMLKSITQVINNSNYIVGNQSSLRLLAAAINKQGLLIGEGSFMNLRPAIICIDGLEKMDFNQQHLIIQSIEHQLVTHKSGLCGNWFFQSYSTILATAYLNSTEFDYSSMIEQNLSVSKHLLSRFDLIFVPEKTLLKEKKTVFIDRLKKERFKNNENIDSLIPKKWKPLITVGMLNSYISYCNQHINPIITANLLSIIEKFSQEHHSTFISCRYRIVETIRKLATAHARMHMRTRVTEDDLEIILEMFASSLTFSKIETNFIHNNCRISNKSNKINNNINPRQLYKVLMKATQFYNKRQFTVDEIVEICGKFSMNKENINQIQVLALLQDLNEKGLLIKRNSNLYELI